MQHKNPVNPITRHKKFSTVMKALHSARGDRSQLFERKGQMRNNSLHSTAQENNNKRTKQKVTHFSRKKKQKSLRSVYLIIFGN